MRVLDVRIFELQPNAALASIRYFGNTKVREKLIKQSETVENCRESISRTRLSQALMNTEAPLSVSVRETSEEMAKEFVSIQQQAGKGDSYLNKAFSEALIDFLSFKGVDFKTISAEKQNLPSSQICPDIQIIYTDGQIVCLELTWRSTGKYVKQTGERKPQNTLTSGHIMKYALEKVMEYVKDLGI